jgi:hypothetical protein
MISVISAGTLTTIGSHHKLPVEIRQVTLSPFVLCCI